MDFSCQAHPKESRHFIQDQWLLNGHVNTVWMHLDFVSLFLYLPPFILASIPSVISTNLFCLFFPTSLPTQSTCSNPDIIHHPTAKDFKLNTTVINQYGGFNLSSPNLYYVDGNQDPWLYATVHSPLAYPRENLSRPDLPYDGGSIIDPGWHRSDENGLPNPADEPERIQKVHAAEIAVVQGWVKEFYEKKGAGVKERAKVGVWKQGL